jgi:hypothetical protein
MAQDHPSRTDTPLERRRLAPGEPSPSRMRKSRIKQVIIGSDLGNFDSIASALGSSYEFRGIRYYAGGGGGAINVFPTPWPIYGPGTQTLMSIYPDLRELLAGQLDDQIRDMIAGAPPGSMLNAWHEVLSLTYTPKYLTPTNVYLMHRKMNTLCRGSQVTYGCLLGGGDLVRLMRYVPPNLGYYGLDLYGNLGIRKHPRWEHPFERWIQFRNLAMTKVRSGHPSLVIGETNCPDEALRPAWFNLVATWLNDYSPRKTSLFTFWADPGYGLSGPWDPHDNATINALRGICSRYAGN